MTTININARMNMLYEFIYSKSFKGDIVMDKMNENDITLDTIKYKEDDELKKELLKGQFKKVYFDEKTNTLIIKRYSDSYSLLYYIKPYDNIKDVDALDSNNNNDALFSYLLSPLILSKKIKHIALPLVNIDMSYEDIEGVLKSFQLDEYFKDMIDNKKISNIFSIRVRECFFKSMTLKEFVESEYFDIKILIYQVLITLDTITNHFKGFTHGALDENSIFIYIKKSDIPFDIKITNYINADIPSMYGRGKNKENDLKHFIECILQYTTIDDDLNKLLKEHKYNINDLLKDKYFKDFTKNISQDKYNMMTNDEYYTGKKASKKASKKLKMEGGATFYRPPEKHIMNDPNVTNEARRVYRMEKEQSIKTQKEPTGPKDKKTTENKPHVEEVKKKEKEPEVIAEQKIIKNSDYIKPPPKKGPPSWDHSYIPKPPPPVVPKAVYHRDDKPMYNMKPKSDEYPAVPKATYHRDDKFQKSEEYSMVPKAIYHRDERRPYSPSYEHKPRDFSPERKYYDERPSRPTTPEHIRHDEQYYKQKEQKNITDYPIIAEQKLYQPPATMGGNIGHSHPKYNNPAWVSIDNQVTYPPAFVPDMQYMPFGSVPLLKPNEIPLQKIYNINLGNPTTHTTLLNNIYQDQLGGDPYAFTMASVAERNHLIHMFRHRLIDKKDGEDMTMQAGNKSVMEYIRLMRFNPYSLGKNPYSQIPLNFLIYSGAYPIRYNTDNRTIEIAKHSMALNIRLYNLNNAALNYNSLGLSENNFDQWREVKYYNYIKTEILNKKISPNFISSILYKLDRVSNINYKALEEIIKTHQTYDYIINAVNNTKEIANLIKSNQTIKDLLDRGKYSKFTKNQDLTADSGVSLMLLTEAPTANIIEWASPVMEKVGGGSISNMTSTGMHPTEAWESILFQLLYAMAVMHNKKIYIRYFSIENNVFIKDLFTDMSNMGHWIYNIDDVDIYVPNYGHVLVIDSRYVDDEHRQLNERKIIGDLFGDRENVQKMIIDDCIKIFTEEDFSNRFHTTYGMLPPEKEVLGLINKIQTTMKSTRDFNKVLTLCFPQYIHNRVGTLLTKVERDALSTNVMPKLIKGKMVVYQSRYDEYRWALYMGDAAGKKKNILLIENNLPVHKEVFNHSLFEHPEAFNIIQNSEKNYKLTKETLIEKYCL